MAKGTRDSGLGRGLSALLGEAALEPEQQGVTQLPIEKVQPNAAQPRKFFAPESISDLADSIRIHGILQPISVRLLASGYYQIISGERRWRAAREAGVSEVPVLIVEADDKKAMELGLIENLQREDLNPMEEALGYQTLISEYGMTQEAVARQVGKSRPAIANALRLLNLFVLYLHRNFPKHHNLYLSHLAIYYLFLVAFSMLRHIFPFEYRCLPILREYLLPFVCLHCY